VEVLATCHRGLAFLNRWNEATKSYTTTELQKFKGRKEPRILPSRLSSSLIWLSGSAAKMKRSTVVTLTSWVQSPKIEHPISCGIHSFDTYREINTQGPTAGNTLNPPIPASQEMPIVQLLFIHHFISRKLCAQPNEWYHVHKK